MPNGMTPGACRDLQNRSWSRVTNVSGPASGEMEASVLNPGCAGGVACYPTFINDPSASGGKSLGNVRDGASAAHELSHAGATSVSGTYRVSAPDVDMVSEAATQ